MAWTIPDKGEPQNNLQTVIFQEYLDVLLAGINGIDCVLSGCAVTAQGSPDMTVAVAKGSILSNGVLLPVTAGNATITAADATNPRLDLVVATSAGAKAVRAGTAAASPKPPARSANDVVLAVVYVPANDTTIGSDQINDLRVVRTVGPITVAKVTTAVVHNTDNALFTYLTVTLPNGLFLTGRNLHVRLGGNYLANSGTPTFTLTIAYGGTTMFADATVAATGDADRGAWLVEFDLTAQSNTDQALTGVVNFQTPGAKTAPATGFGDLAVVTHVNAPFNGAAAVDSDAADRALLVSWTMNVSNLADEIVMEFATAELS